MNNTTRFAQAREIVHVMEQLVDRPIPEAKTVDEVESIRKAMLSYIKVMAKMIEEC